MNGKKEFGKNKMFSVTDKQINAFLTYNITKIVYLCVIATNQH